MDKTMGWCDAHITSQSDASKDFHVKEVDCERFVSAEDLIPDITVVLAKARKITRLAWIVALGFYVVTVFLVFLSPGGLGKSLILAAVLLVTIPAVRALTRALAEAVTITDEDKRLIPKVQFLSENEILTEDDFHDSEVR